MQANTIEGYRRFNRSLQNAPGVFTLVCGARDLKRGEDMLNSIFATV
jgi:hypothetical protein